MKNLQAIREAKGVSRRKLAYEADLSEQALRNIEKGADPKLSTVVRIAAALEVTIPELLGDAA